MQKMTAPTAAMAAWLLATNAAWSAPQSEVARLKRDLLTHPSATAVLTSWCGANHLADPPKVLALRQQDDLQDSKAKVRRLLQADTGEKIVHRSVDLVCGRHILSRADNWYRPQLLTPDMNRRLEMTDAPFGQVVGPLEFHRQTLDIHTLGGRDVLRLRARLITPHGVPFALVTETYSAEILGEGP